MRSVLSVVTFLSLCSTAHATDPAELTAELNMFRIQNGLAPLVTDANLCSTCQSWALHLASTNQFYHGGGEQIIAKGQQSAREVIAAWLRSPGHRAWLLSANSSCGWGVAVGRDGQLVWAGAFGGNVTTETVCTSVGCGSSTITTMYRERVRIRERFRIRGR